LHPRIEAGVILLKRYFKPTARKVGIYKNIGWHTFRHSFGTILKANGED
jgi:site-specific recombinase XerD